jgi:hypothetical protein
MTKKSNKRKISGKKSTRKTSGKKSTRKTSGKKSIRKTSGKKSTRKTSGKKNKLHTILQKTNNNTDNKHIKQLTFKELNELPNFEKSFVSQCQNNANDRITNNKLTYKVNQNDIKKYCSCTYNSLVNNKKNIHHLEKEIFDTIKPCIKNFNKSTKKFSNNNKKEKLNLPSKTKINKTKNKTKNKIKNKTKNKTKNKSRK